MNIGSAPAKLNEITDKVWRMVLGFRLEPVERGPARPEAQDFVLACVTFTGTWQGVLTLGCSTTVARRAAATMFGILPQDAAPEEIRDALGELTNMVGGNFKTLLKDDCRLSIPSAVDTIPLAQAEPAPIKHQWFQCEGGLVLLHVLSKRSGP